MSACDVSQLFKLADGFVSQVDNGASDVDKPARMIMHDAKRESPSIASADVVQRRKRGAGEAPSLPQEAKRPKPKFAVSAKVEAKYRAIQGGKAYFAGVVCATNDNGTYKINYDDGDIEEMVCERHVRDVPDVNVKEEVAVVGESINVGGDSPFKQHVTTGELATQRLLEVKAELEEDNDYLHLNEGYMLTDAQASKAKLKHIRSWATRRAGDGAPSSELFDEIKRILDAPVPAQHETD